MSSATDAAAPHAGARRAVLAMLRRGALPHALLVTGEPGLGQRDLAGWVAAARWCREPGAPCGACRACRLVASGNHPDLLVVVRNPPREADPDELGSRHEITVDQVRRGVIPFLSLRAVEGGGRTVLVDEADTLNEGAQNALLKTLEEPPPGTLLLLLAAQPDALLDTVRSRCQELRLAPLDEPAMRALFPDEPPARLALAAGRPGQVARLAGLDAAALQRTLDDVLDGRCAGTAFARAAQEAVAALAQADEEGDAADAHRLAAEVCLAHLRDRLAAGGAAPEGAAAALFELAADLRRHVPPAVAWVAAGIELAGGHVGPRVPSSP